MCQRSIRRRDSIAASWQLWAADQYLGRETKARLLLVAETQSFFYLDDRLCIYSSFDKLVSLDYKLTSVVVLDVDQ